MHWYDNLFLGLAIFGGLMVTLFTAVGTWVIVSSLKFGIDFAYSKFKADLLKQRPDLKEAMGEKPDAAGQPDDKKQG